MRKIIGLEFISVCNLKCKMCPCVERFTGDRLHDQVVFQIFDDIAKYNSEVDKNKKGIHTIRFDGNNEPLLVPNIHQFIADAKRINPEACMYLVTNGLLLNEDMSDKLIASGIDKLHISITGNTPEVYAHFQGYGLADDELIKNFETVKANARYFIKKSKENNSDIEVVLSFIMNQNSYKDVSDYANYWHGLGASLDIRGCDGEYKKYVKKDRIISENVSGYKRCQVLGHMLIKSNGDLLLSCCAKDVPVLGNVLQNNLYDILTSNEFTDLEDAFANLRMDEIPEICANCGAMHIYKKTEKTRVDKHSSSKTVTESFSLKKDIGIFDNSGFRKNTLHEFNRQLAGRKLVLFGAGILFGKTMDFLGSNTNIPICGIIDNDKNKQGHVFHGLHIQPVEAIADNDVDDMVVLMTMERPHKAEKQLRDLGVRRYFSSILFPEYY